MGLFNSNERKVQYLAHAYIPYSGNYTGLQFIQLQFVTFLLSIEMQRKILNNHFIFFKVFILWSIYFD